MDDFDSLWYDDEDVETSTSLEQCSCERTCARFLLAFDSYDAGKLDKLKQDEIVNDENEICLMRDLHASYLEKGLTQTLPGGFVSLDASRPWLCYWILHALHLLNREPIMMFPDVVSFLGQCQNASTSGGFGGGPGQISHCAPTYAATLALCTIGTKEAYLTINRAKMYAFFWSMKSDRTGAFTMHRDGETDTRSVYTVLAVARLLNILTPELTAGCADFLISCQSYEGGFGGEPGNEAHGGYNFCALAGLVILNQGHRIDLDAQEYWIQRRQVRLEGGFQGRTNKTVDSCYSFWQGSAAALVNVVRGGRGDTADLDVYVQKMNEEGVNRDASVDAGVDVDVGVGAGAGADADVIDMEANTDGASTKISRASDTGGSLPVNQMALQRYILHCGQQIEQDRAGGLRDKPGKSRDYYHSCYALSGLSIAQSFPLDHSQGTSSASTSVNATSNAPSSARGLPGAGWATSSRAPSAPTPTPTPTSNSSSSAHVYGDLSNLIEPTSAVFNIGLPKLKRALDFFGALPVRSHQEWLREAAESV